jgi:hypothetical protein
MTTKGEWHRGFVVVQRGPTPLLHVFWPLSSLKNGFCEEFPANPMIPPKTHGIGGRVPHEPISDARTGSQEDRQSCRWKEADRACPEPSRREWPPHTSLLGWAGAKG